MPSVLWNYCSGVRKSIRLVKKLSDKVLVWLSVWSEMPMIYIWSSWWYCHPIISCFIKIQIGLTFLVPAYPGRPGIRGFNTLGLRDRKGIQRFSTGTDGGRIPMANQQTQVHIEDGCWNGDGSFWCHSLIRHHFSFIALTPLTGWQEGASLWKTYLLRKSDSFNCVMPCLTQGN